jgi:hypothetical protein
MLTSALERPGVRGAVLHGLWPPTLWVIGDTVERGRTAAAVDRASRLVNRTTVRAGTLTVTLRTNPRERTPVRAASEP